MEDLVLGEDLRGLGGIAALRLGGGALIHVTAPPTGEQLDRHAIRVERDQLLDPARRGDDPVVEVAAEQDVPHPELAPADRSLEAIRPAAEELVLGEIGRPVLAVVGAALVEMERKVADHVREDPHAGVDRAEAHRRLRARDDAGVGADAEAGVASVEKIVPGLVVRAEGGGDYAREESHQDPIPILTLSQQA